MSRNFLSIDVRGFEELMSQIDKLGKDLKPIVEDALVQAAETVGDDTLDIVRNKGNLPAGGKYSTGATAKTVVTAPKATWSGYTCEVNAGFKHGDGGAGLILITGTPRQAPAKGIEDIYARKKYQKLINEGIQEVLEDYL